MHARFTFNVCHDGQWEVRDGAVIIARVPSRAAALSMAKSLAQSATMLGQEARVAEIGECPPPQGDVT